MQPIRKILVALDHSSLDHELVDYAQFFVSISEVTDVHFMHEVKLNFSSKMLKEFPLIEKRTIDDRKNELEEVIKLHFNPKREVNCSFTITNDDTGIKPFVQAIAKESIDMVMVGSKHVKHGGGTFTQRIVRRAQCHVLTVPIGSSSHLKRSEAIKKILVPIDFSNHSKNALERAIMIGAQTEDKVEIICQNVFTVPSGYHYSGKSRKEFAEIMKTHAKESFSDFIEKIDTKGIKITPVYSNDVDDNKTSDIRLVAAKYNVDGIVLGSRGKTTAALLLGSVAEKLIQTEKHYPILVVRKKNDHEGFLERIRKL